MSWEMSVGIPGLQVHYQYSREAVSTYHQMNTSLWLLETHS